MRDPSMGDTAIEVIGPDGNRRCETGPSASPRFDPETVPGGSPIFQVSDAPFEFHGTERYECIREIGRGGMGRVYEVFDRERELRVALKTMSKRDSRWLVRFKREFRLVADLHHPNIATLYDLQLDRDSGFFTMELVDGTDLLTYVLGRSAPSVSSPTPQGERTAGNSGSGARSARRRWDEAITGRLERVLSQLAEALETLHERGILHLDLKPSNVLVTPSGRVKLLDFGISRAIAGFHEDRTHLEGTPAYMAPEQIRDAPVDSAADLYALGSLLYACLTGRPPHVGSQDGILSAKRSAAPITVPSERTAGIPERLEHLALELLEDRPERRPTAHEVVERLRRTEHASAAVPSGIELFVGRREELEVLSELAERSRTTSAFAIVRAPSGMGKSALIRRFVQSRPDALVLMGRCHERESVPFRAFDAGVDALVENLCRFAPHEVDELLPDDLRNLERLFPAFGLLRRRDSARGRPPLTPSEERAAASADLRTLFERLGRRRPVIVVIDDLQWTDRESLDLLTALLESRPFGPPVLYVASMRSDVSPETARAIERALASLSPQCRATLDLKPLRATEQRALAAALSDDVPEAVWSAAGGVPLVLSELVQHAVAHGAPVHSFEDAVRTRLERLSPTVRELLVASATATRPTPLSVLAQVAGVDAQTREHALATLRAGRLLRTVRPAADPWVDVVHDRLRESILELEHARGPAEDRARHHRLAEVLAGREDIRQETVASHWLAAGRPELAAAAWERAGHDASERLAFDAAADFFEASLRHGAPDPERAARLLSARAEALVNAGRCREAAAVFGEASLIAVDPEQRERLARRHAEELLHAGAYEEGKAAMREVLRSRGLDLARTMPGALGALASQRMRLSWRRYRESPNRRRLAAPHRHERLELLFNVSNPLVATDPITGAGVAARNLLEALRYGTDEQVLLAMTNNSMLMANEGQFDSPIYLRFEERLRACIDAGASRRLEAYAQLALGACAFVQGSWSESQERLARSAELFAVEPGSAFPRHTAVLYLHVGAAIAGRIRFLVDGTHVLIRQAERHGNPYEWVSSSLVAAYRGMFSGDIVGARDYFRRVAPALPSKAGIPHCHFVTGEAFLNLYENRPDEGVARMDAWARAFRRALLFSNPTARAWFFEFFGRVAAMAGDRRRLRMARVHLEAVVRKLPFVEGTIAYLRAAEAKQRGQLDDVRMHLEQSLAAYERRSMGLWVPTIQYALGSLVGGDEGRTLSASAMSWARREGIADPERWLRRLQPL